MHVLVTGASGLIGSEAVSYYAAKGAHVVGIDNNMRAQFFGPKGDTTWNLDRLKSATPNFVHYPADIRDRECIDDIFKLYPFDLIIHCAAQPSHDKAKEFPLLDFEVNATGTLNLLEATRVNRPDAVFIFMSTNKVYGDSPNEVPLVELETRWDYASPADYDGINESCRIDQSIHSLFGASKLAADILVQEYGRYFDIPTVCFRGGCLTGPSHSGVELHGFLSYLVHTVTKSKPYTIFGYKGKQVRDQIHSYDVLRAFDAFYQNPRPGEVYNLGGGRENSISMIEAIELIENQAEMKLDYSYSDTNRIGDHICYISDLAKFQAHYPAWRVTIGLEQMIEEMVEAERMKN